jgi:hypothetical protein
MIYAPNAKELVYSELYFISTSFPRTPSAISIYAAMDEIMDAVSGEVYELFFGIPMDVAPAAGQQAGGTMEMLFGIEIRN